MPQWDRFLAKICNSKNHKFRIPEVQIPLVPQKKKVR